MTTAYDKYGLPLGAGFVLYSGASLAWAPGGQGEAALYLLALVSAWLAGMVVKDHRRVWFWFCVALCAAIPVYLWTQAVNPNVGGGIIVLALAFAIAYNFVFFYPFAALGLALYPSRSACVAAALIILLGLGRFWRFIAALGALAAVAVALQKEGVAMSLYNRMGIWQDTINATTFFGHGFGSFQTVYETLPRRTNMFLQVAPHAYNDFLEMAMTLGIGAALLWVFLALAYEAAEPPLRLALCAYAVISLAFFPFWFLGPLLAFAIGGLSNNGVKYEIPTRFRPLYQ